MPCPAGFGAGASFSRALGCLQVRKGRLQGPCLLGAGVSVGCTRTCWCCHLVGPHEHSSATALCPSPHAFYSSLALIYILLGLYFVAMKLFLETASVKAVIVTGFTHSFMSGLFVTGQA